MKKQLFFILRVLITLGIFYTLFKFIPYGEVLSIYKNSQKIFIALGFLLLFIDHILASCRWRYILTHLGIRISIREAIYTFFSANFFNLFFPSLLAQDAARALFLSRRFNAPKRIAASVMMDRASGLVALTFVVVIAYLLGMRFITEREIILGVGIIIVLGSAALFLLFHRFLFGILEKMLVFWPRWHKRIEELHREFDIIRENPSIFFKSVFFHSILIQILSNLSFYFIAKGLFADVGLIYFFIFIPIAMLIAFIPVTIAGLGTREAAIVYLFAKVGVLDSVSLGMSLLNFSFLVLLSLIGGLVYVMVYHRWVQRNP